MVRVFVFFIALILILSYLYRFINKQVQTSAPEILYEIPELSNAEDRYFIPDFSTGQIVHHHYYSLSYMESYEQAEWVAYELTKKSIQIPNVTRASNFLVDPLISSGTLSPDDYRNSGFTRGHLVPAGDMAFNDLAMSESFYMSNVSPQLEEFNRGIWNQLEMQVRDWAYNNGRIFVVTGPVLGPLAEKDKAQGKLYIPEAFYKVILDLDGRDQKGVGFLVPHNTESKDLYKFMTNIDSIESITGLDFFSQLMDTQLQTKLESQFNPESWPVKNYNSFR
jgi:endonuclease G